MEQSGVSCVIMSSRHKSTFKHMLDNNVGRLEFLIDTGADASMHRILYSIGVRWISVSFTNTEASSKRIVRSPLVNTLSSLSVMRWLFLRREAARMRAISSSTENGFVR